MQHSASTNVLIQYLYDTLMLVHAMTCNIVKLLYYKNVCVSATALYM